MRALLLFLIAFFPALAAATTPLSADIALRRIEMHASFSGTEMLLFGARNAPGDIVVVIRGPARNITIRERERVAGMWMYVRKAKYDKLPQFFAIASSRPLTAIGAPALLTALQISPDALIRTQRTTASTPLIFDHAIMRLLEKRGLFLSVPQPVTFFGNTLFKTRIRFPDTTPRGNYTAEVYLIDNGQLIAAQTLPFVAIKTGFEAWLFDLAHHRPALYGALCVLLAFAIGWIGYRIFRKR
jgi:uncharacterized protein (TIGR02186 family)